MDTETWWSQIELKTWITHVCHSWRKSERVYCKYNLKNLMMMTAHVYKKQNVTFEDSFTEVDMLLAGIPNSVINDNDISSFK